VKATDEAPGRDRSARAGSSIAFLVIAAAALIALDLVHFTPAAVASALALAAFVAAYIVWLPRPRFGLYVFIVAEVSAISLGADLSTALIYQVFSVLLLSAIIAPRPRVASLRFYRKPALLTVLVAAIALTPGLALVYTSWLTALQAASLSGAILVVLAVILIVVRQNNTWLQRSARA
jgi:hypothetical protein